MKVLGRDVSVTVNTYGGKVTLGPGLRRARAVISAIGVLAGIAILGGSFYLMRLTHLDEFFFRRATAQGQVIENRYSVSPSRSRDMPRGGYRAILAFQASNGREMKVSSFFSTQRPRYEIGQTLAIFYDPASPDHFAVDEGLPTYLIAIVPLAMGILMIVGGVQGLFKRD